jgi:hypothetical protein
MVNSRENATHLFLSVQTVIAGSYSAKVGSIQQVECDKAAARISLIAHYQATTLLHLRLPGRNPRVQRFRNGVSHCGQFGGLGCPLERP